jgi:hypothetical protein
VSSSLAIYDGPEDFPEIYIGDYRLIKYDLVATGDINIQHDSVGGNLKGTYHETQYIVKDLITLSAINDEGKYELNSGDPEAYWDTDKIEAGQSLEGPFNEIHGHNRNIE